MCVVAAMTLPNFISAYNNVRLKSACSDLSAFMQRARIQAAKQNAAYPILYRTVGLSTEAYLDTNLNGQWDNLEPVIALNSNVKMAPGAPNGTGGAPAPYVLVGDSAGLTYDNTTTLGYSPRGLPCAYAAGVCNTPAAGYFVFYLKDQRATNVGWGAVIVTRSGRTKVSTWTGTAWQ
jgi:Tfp pilus assembly protein FimT